MGKLSTRTCQKLGYGGQKYQMSRNQRFERVAVELPSPGLWISTNYIARLPTFSPLRLAYSTCRLTLSQRRPRTSLHLRRTQYPTLLSTAIASKRYTRRDSWINSRPERSFS